MGVVLVIQPDFIFAQSIPADDKQLNIGNQTSNNLANGSKIGTNQSFSKREDHSDNGITEFKSIETNQYYIGVIMTFASALTAGLAMVLSAKAKEYCSNNLLMAVVGCGTFIVGAIGPLLNLENRFYINLENWTPSLKDISLTTEVTLAFGVAILSLVGILLLIQASQICPPIIVSLVRSCEIILGLFLEKVILINLIPELIDSTDERMLSCLILGAMLVLISVYTMSMSDWVQQYIDMCLRNKQKDKTNMASEIQENKTKLLD